MLHNFGITLTEPYRHSNHSISKVRWDCCVKIGTTTSIWTSSIFCCSQQFAMSKIEWTFTSHSSVTQGEMWYPGIRRDHARRDHALVSGQITSAFNFSYHSYLIHNTRGSVCTNFFSNPGSPSYKRNLWLSWNSSINRRCSWFKFSAWKRRRLFSRSELLPFVTTHTFAQ
jgi:hypothetical protein